MTTLEDLRRAVSAVPACPVELTREDLNVKEPYRTNRMLAQRAGYIEHYRLKSEAWEAAYRWRIGWNGYTTFGERVEGEQLIARLTQ